MDPELQWIRDWLWQRKDVLEKNANATTWAYDKYYPRENTEDVRDAGWRVEHYDNFPNPLVYLKGYTPTQNRINKLIYSLVENIQNTPKTEVGPGTSDRYSLKGVYVEPNIVRNKGSHYIAFAGKPNPEVKIHEYTHASHPDLLEEYIQNVIFNNSVPTVVPPKFNSNPNKENERNAKEIYAALQEFRYKNKLKPRQKIDKKYLNDNRSLFENTYLKNIDDESLIRLFNEVAKNNIYPRQQDGRYSV